MYKFNYFLKQNKKIFTRKFSIRNKELPICSNCIHFIEYKNNYPYDEIPNNEKYARCKKFGEVNLITGLINYDFADMCRSNNNKCGKFGSEYVEKNKS